MTISLLNDEQMSNKVGVERQPAIFLLGAIIQLDLFFSTRVASQ